MFERAGEAVQNPAEASWPPVFVDHVQTIGPGIAAVNDDGKLCLLRKGHLIAEDAVLRFARRMIVVVVETDLAPGDDFGMLRQLSQLIQMLLRDFLGFMGMNANGGVNPVMLFGKWQCGIELLAARPGADSEQSRDSSRTRAIEHGFAVLRELREVDVCVRVDEFHWRNLAEQGRSILRPFKEKFTSIGSRFRRLRRGTRLGR